MVEAGYTVELDCWDWSVGENFVTRIRCALDTAHRVVALFSPAYFEEIRYTTDEWSSALIKNDDGGHRLVPVQVEPCVVPRLLGPLMRVELFDVDEAWDCCGTGSAWHGRGGQDPGGDRIRIPLCRGL